MIEHLIILANGLAISLGYITIGILPVVAFSILMKRKR